MSIPTPNFIVWFKNSQNNFETYNYATKEFKTQLTLPYTINQFEMFKNYEPNENGLRQFSIDLIKWRNEILSESQFDYFDNKLSRNGQIFYRTHNNNIIRFVMMNKQRDLVKMEQIELFEEEYYDKCNNGGLMYHKDGLYENVYTYDKKQFYPSILNNEKFLFPTTKGTVSNIYKIPKCGFSFGIYHVQISSNDEKFNKIFSYSKDNHYTHTTLNFVMNIYNTYHGNNVQLKLLSNKCLKYIKKSELIESSKVFSKWYHVLTKLKTKFPNNKLIKKMFSTAWGALQAKNVIIKTEDQIEKEDIDYGTSLDVNKNRYYINDFYTQNNSIEIYNLIDLTKPIYKYQLRLKPFLTSYARKIMMLIALKNIDNVIRVMTDSITYDSDVKVDEYLFVKESDKSNIKAEIKGNQLIKLQL